MKGARTVFLLATERHVDAALQEGKSAITWRAFLLGITAAASVARSGNARQGATPEMTHLATSLALDSLQAELKWAAGHAVVRALDDALGTLRRAGTDVAALRRARHPRAEVLAEFLERTDVLLARAGVFDNRAIGWVAAACIEVAPEDDLPHAVIIDGLFQWDSSTLAWVEALSRRVPVTVRMPRSADALLSELEGRWQALPNAPNLELFDLAFPAAVSLIEAATGTAEARVIAGEVREALRLGNQCRGHRGGASGARRRISRAAACSLRRGADRVRRASWSASDRSTGGSRRARMARSGGVFHRDGIIDLLRSNAVDPAPFVDGTSLELRRRRALALASRLARVPVGTNHNRTLLLQVLSAEIDPRSDDIWMHRLPCADPLGPGRFGGAGRCAPRSCPSWSAPGSRCVWARLRRARLPTSWQASLRAGRRRCFRVWCAKRRWVSTRSSTPPTA